jgi:hypothetical protein
MCSAKGDRDVLRVRETCASMPKGGLLYRRWTCASMPKGGTPSLPTSGRRGGGPSPSPPSASLLLRRRAWPSLPEAQAGGASSLPDLSYSRASTYQRSGVRTQG